MRNKANRGESAGRSRRSVVQTKPIPGGAGPPPRRAKCAKRTQFGKEFRVLGRVRPWSGLQTSHFTLQTRPKAVRAKQTQFGLASLACGGRNAPNKPNLPPANCQGRRRGRLYKQSQFEHKWWKENRLWCIGHPGDLRGSKANPRRPIRRPLVQTKPILRPRFVQGAGARQSRQTNPICPRTGPVVQTKPVGPGTRRDARFCQTKPIWSAALVRRGRNAPNKANSPPPGQTAGVAAGGRVYKQTQFERK
jgi:hypothetical protein